MLQWLALAFNLVDPSSITGSVGFFFLFFTISDFEPMRTRFLMLRNVAISHDQIATDGLHVVCL